MRSWPKWRSDRAAQLLIIILLLSHLPFITADPDRDISFSRGPFTDEGLNTIQVRNFINHGYLSLEECDNLLKTPLFGLTEGITMFIFGTDLAVGRLTVSILLVLALFFLSGKKPFSGLILLAVPLLFMKYPVFHFSHFSLAEAPAVATILLGVYFLHQTYRPFRQEKDYIKSALLAGTFLSLSWYFKIQFIYILALGPLVAVERAFQARKLNRRILWLNGMVIAATTLLFLLIYMLAWYLPSKGTYDHMMAHQSGAFELGPKTGEYIRFNVTHFFLSSGNIAFTITFLVSLVAGILLLFRKSSPHFPLLFKTSVIWVVLELHKLTMVYLPTRYQVSLFAAMGLLTAIVLLEIYHTQWLSKEHKWRWTVRTLVVTWTLAILLFNLSDYRHALERRTYRIHQANAYLASTLTKNDTVLGAWAPSLTWGSDCIAKPVWGGFLNDVEPLERFQPRAVISEPDEQDSEQAYKKQGIDLYAVSDSSRTFEIGRWEVVIFWIGPAAGGTLSGL